MERYERTLWSRAVMLRAPWVGRLKNKTLQKLFLGLFAPAAWRDIRRSREQFILPYVELVVTERCNYRCESCANCMFLYDHPGDYPLADVTAQVDRLAELCSEVYELQVLGGEPLLYRELPALLAHFRDKPQFRQVRVITNGSIMPSQEVIDVMKADQRMYMVVSNYGELSPKLDDIKRLCKNEGIRCVVFAYENWQDFGPMERQYLSPEDVARSYALCGVGECKTLLKGRLFTCPRSAHMHNVHLIDETAHSLDIMNPATTTEDVRRFHNQQPPIACRYCNPPWARPSIPAAVQLRKNTQEAPQ